jgi:hypothetical protein
VYALDGCFPPAATENRPDPSVRSNATELAGTPMASSLVRGGSGWPGAMAESAAPWLGGCREELNILAFIGLRMEPKRSWHLISLAL